MSAVIDSAPLAFRARVIESSGMRALEDDQPTGEAEILVAVFDVEDTEVAVGNSRRQIIDPGAFRAWQAAKPWAEQGGIPGFADHGEAMFSGVYRSSLKIGKTLGAEETDEGLLLRTSYNLQKQVGREAYSDLVHDPEGVQFSFGWDKSKEKTDMRDGAEHVTELWLTEWSQVGFGAQRLARLVTARSRKGAGMRERNLEELPDLIRRAWYDQAEALARALDTKSWPYVEAIFAADDSDEKGHVIARVGDDWMKVRWELDDEGEVAFDTTEAEKVEQQWVPAKRASALATMNVEQLREASDLVLDLNGPDPIAEFYRSRFATR